MMDASTALRILRSLADGVDPETGERFPPSSPYQRADVVRALYAAISVLDASPRTENASAPRPEHERAGAEPALPGDGDQNILDAARSRYPSPVFHPVLITEVTRMLHDHFCIAAYDIHARRMVRPLRPRGENWIFDEFQAAYRSGQLVNVKSWSPRPDGLHPHCLEDMVLSGGMDDLEVWTNQQLFAAMVPAAFHAIAQLFDRRPQENSYVIEGTDCRSLGGVKTVRGSIRFLANRYNRMRLQIEDIDGELYNLPVTCDRLRSLFSPDTHPQGIQAANEWLAEMPAEEPLILRVGLGRGYAGGDGEFNPRRCYVQINGLLTARAFPTT